MDDLQEVLEAVMQVSKWNMLGIALGIKPSAVDDIKASNMADSHSCREAVVKAWLSQQYIVSGKSTPPSWKTLVHALQSDLVSNKALAYKIAKQHPQ